MKKNIIKISVFLILLFLCLGYLTNLLERKYSANKLNGFFDEKENFDVLFFGTSHLINSVYPMQLYNDYGIISYNMGNNSSNIPTTYWILKMALNYKKPKLVVIDCYSLSKNYKIARNDSLHNVMDGYPLSLTKIKAVQDLYKDPNLIEGGRNDSISKTELFWNFVAFHSRWNELTKSDFIADSSLLKGSDIVVKYRNSSKLFQSNTNSILNKDGVAVEYLIKMIEECKKNDIEVLLTYFPMVPSEMDKMEANTAEVIAKEYNLKYLNFLDINLINSKYEYADEGNHINVSGASNVTKYIGQYIMDNYDIKDRRSDNNYIHWKEDYNNYKIHKLSIYDRRKYLSDHILLMSGDNYNYIIELLDDKLYKNKNNLQILELLGINLKEISKNTDLIVISNDKVQYYENFHRSNKIVESSLGKIKYIDSKDKYRIYFDNEKIYEITNKQNNNISMRIGILEKESNEVLKTTKFYLDSGYGFLKKQ